MRIKMAAGNWKMNGIEDSLSEIKTIAKISSNTEKCEVLICPPFTLLPQAVQSAHGSSLQIGAQNCHQAPSGAFTGEISANMLADLGIRHVILGHSERREYFGEHSQLVREKAEAAHKAGLTAIICVGETLNEREAGKEEDIVQKQLMNSIPQTSNAQNTVIAYEPVWAIGTGKIPSSDEIAKMHSFIRSIIPDANNMRILYGGSVKAENAQEIFEIPDVDGGLVGGASLKAQDFSPIIEAANKENNQ